MRRAASTLALVLVAASPFLAEHPKVSEGNSKLQAGESEAALSRYNDAEQELGKKAELDFNRGNAFYRMKRFDEAKSSYQKALESKNPALKASDYYNMGNALAHLGESQDAARAYRQSLALDPKDDAARYNLEVMLRRIKEKKDQPKDQKPDGGSDGGPPHDGGQDGGTSGDAGRPDGGAAGDGGRDGGGEPQSDQDGGSRGDGGRPQSQDAGNDDSKSDGGPGGSADAKPPPPPEVNKQEAEKLLDALKAREKNLPMWKVQPKKAKSKHVEKDW